MHIALFQKKANSQLIIGLEWLHKTKNDNLTKGQCDLQLSGGTAQYCSIGRHQADKKSTTTTTYPSAQ